MSTVISQEDLRDIFAANLAEAMELRGWTQGELARRLFGQSDTAQRVKVSRWIKKVNLPDATELRNLAEVLGTSIDMMLSRK